MSKKQPGARKIQTHFETVPVELVKQIAAAEVAGNSATTGADETVARPPKRDPAGSRPPGGRKPARRP
jgi:hypothetical protein